MLKDGKLDTTSPIPQLQRSPALTKRGERFSNTDGDLCFFDDWRKMAYDNTMYKWLTCLEYALGSLDRFYIRVQAPFAEFRKRIVPYTEEDPSTPLDLVAEIKVTDVKGFKEKLGDLLGQPRSKLFMVTCGDDVAFWYIVESTSADMRKRYEEALARQRR